ncbi:MAG: sigma-54-dependent Fis family transcriptional regulator [Verrucomicrobia bacterium]|nr:sigma-54-dependent Fis family transcriptional regulator [Verrucomicrobiota bacterium]
MARILLVDDQPAMAEWVANFCRDRGHQTFQFNSSEAALVALPGVAPQLVVAELHTERPDGIEFLRECRANHPQIVVLITGAFAPPEMGLKAVELGAFDYVTKPFKADELQSCLQRALDHQASLSRHDDLRREGRDQYRFENLIGTSAKMEAIYRLIGKVADTESTILIQGEPGTGKELVARALHFTSSRQNHPFVTINCSALTDNELESELFGHKKGAFTGAVTDKIGLFEEGHNGTIFLDEVDSMSQQLQTRLLRVLQERQIRQVGDTRKIPVNVRSIAASNESLKAKTRNGGFREDLYFRLSVIPIEIPPLRERLEDIPLLVRCFLQKHADRTGTERKTIEENAMQRLVAYNWPGNVRELENAIERACALSEGGVVRACDLPPQVLHISGILEKELDSEWRVGKQLDDFVRHQERRYIEMTLKHNQGSREKTATMLGISIATLYRKLDLKHHRG